jgi:hypothetical protein
VDRVSGAGGGGEYVYSINCALLVKPIQ